MNAVLGNFRAQEITGQPMGGCRIRPCGQGGQAGCLGRMESSYSYRDPDATKVEIWVYDKQSTGLSEQ